MIGVLPFVIEVRRSIATSRCGRHLDYDATMTVAARHRRAGACAAQGPAARPSGRRAAAGHVAGVAARSAACRRRRPTPARWRPGSTRVRMPAAWTSTCAASRSRWRRWPASTRCSGWPSRLPRTRAPTAACWPSSASRPPCSSRTACAVEAAIEAMLQGLQRSGLPSGLILCAMRERSVAEAERVAQLARRYLGQGRGRLRPRRRRTRASAERARQRVRASRATAACR